MEKQLNLVKHLMPVTYTMVYSHSISQSHDIHMTSGEFYTASNNANSWGLVKSRAVLHPPCSWHRGAAVSEAAAVVAGTYVARSYNHPH